MFAKKCEQERKLPDLHVTAGVAPEICSGRAAKASTKRVLGACPKREQDSSYTGATLPALNLIT